VTTSDLPARFEAWLAVFDNAWATEDVVLMEGLFLDPSYLRDNGALTFDYRQFHGRDEVCRVLFGVKADAKPTNFRLAEGWPEPSLVNLGVADVVEAYFEFDTTFGSALAIVQGEEDADAPHGFRARALFTRLERVVGTEDPVRFPEGVGYEPTRMGETWAEHQAHRMSFSDREPEVLVAGAGQSGLMIAAELDRLGIDYVVVDKNARLGDNWRLRYNSLALHNPTIMNHFLRLDFPSHYPEYMSKDHMADWHEIYGRYFGLNVWLSTAFESAEFDEQANVWNAQVVTADGTRRTLRPRHIVMSTGSAGSSPFIPDLPGIEDFGGTALHSSKFSAAADFDVRSALVLGLGSSGHDIALDLHSRGVDVTLVQRGPVVAVDLDTANLAYAGYKDGVTPPDVTDLRFCIAAIDPIRVAACAAYNTLQRQLDADLIEGLERAGMVIGDGVDHLGWFDLYFRRGGGYYINVGASQAIIDGGIKVLQNSRIDRFVPSGVRLDDGSVLEADLVVMATGYHNRRHDIARHFGTDVADRVGDIAVFEADGDGEWANLYGQTAQRNLWMMGGGILQVRQNAPRTAMLIQADLKGLIPDSYRRGTRKF